MQGIEKIKKRIMDEAKAEAKNVKAEAAKQTAETRAKSKARLAELEERYTERTKAAVTSYRERTLAQTRLDAKKRILSDREAVIDEAIASVKEKLDHSSAGYKRYLEKTVKESLPLLSGSITITCAKADVKAIGALAKKAKVIAGKVGAGMIFEDSAGRRIDASLNALLLMKKDAIRQEIAHLLGA